MPETGNDADPRSTWRWVLLLRRATPGWMLRLVGGIASRVIMWRYRDSFDKNSPEYRQFHLWVHGTNADLYRDHVKAALDVLAAYAPVHMRWLRTRIDALLVNQLFMMTRTVTAADHRHRVLMLHPYTVWMVSPGQLALYLVAEATRLRLGRRFTQNRAGMIRADRRVLQEAVACARILPDNEALVVRWEKRLGAFNTRFPEAAA